MALCRQMHHAIGTEFPEERRDALAVADVQLGKGIQLVPLHLPQAGEMPRVCEGVQHADARQPPAHQMADQRRAYETRTTCDDKTKHEKCKKGGRKKEEGGS